MSRQQISVSHEVTSLISSLGIKCLEHISIVFYIMYQTYPIHLPRFYSNSDFISVFQPYLLLFFVRCCGVCLEL